MKCASCLAPREPPLDGDVVTIHSAAPGAGLSAEFGYGVDSALAQALSAEQADLHFGWIQPASVFGGVMEREAVPDPVSNCFPKAINDSFAGVSGEIIQHQMDGIGLRISGRDLQQVIGELMPTPGRRNHGEVPSRLRFRTAEHIGCSTTSSALGLFSPTSI